MISRSKLTVCHPEKAGKEKGDATRNWLAGLVEACLCPWAGEALGWTNTRLHVSIRGKQVSILAFLLPLNSNIALDTVLINQSTNVKEATSFTLNKFCVTACSYKMRDVFIDVFFVCFLPDVNHKAVLQRKVKHQTSIENGVWERYLWFKKNRKNTFQHLIKQLHPWWSEKDLVWVAVGCPKLQYEQTFWRR